MWTLFSEKPPPSNGWYLVTFRWKDEPRYEDDIVCRDREIYAWMELPEPYDGDGEPVDGATDIWPSK